ncbi:MAG: DUF4235 domain-containing protein [Actinomycetota bacterium]|nr:DUF4235 domain-containing protein [Actinomycetota bacterium]
MSKVLFAPISIGGGLVAGLIGKKLFEQLWGVIDDEEPPDPKHRDVPWGRVILALLLEGAIFRAVRGLVDRGARIGFSRVTGSWPGETAPEPE